LKNYKTHFWQIGKISFPLTLATASGTLLVFIDSLFATRISINSYEAVFLTLPIMGIGASIGVAIAAAIADLVSKQNELDQIKRLILGSYFLCLISATFFVFFGVFQTGVIENVAGLNKLSTDSMIVSEFRTYWKVIIWTLPMQIVFALIVQFLTMLEKLKEGMVIILISLVLNVVLDYAFTQVMPWGVSGLAYSTMGVFTCSIILSIIPLRKEAWFLKPYPSINDSAFFSALGKLSMTTFLIFLTMVIFSIAAIVLNNLALKLKAGSLVVFAVFRQIMEIIILTTRGVAGGYLIYFGNALRDKRTEEYLPIYWAATSWQAVANIIGIIMMVFFPDMLINFFSNIDPALFPDIKKVFLIAALILSVFILSRMAQMSFISFDKPIYLVLSSVVFVTVQLIAANYWLDSKGIFGLVYAELLSGIVLFIIFLPLFFYLILKRKKVDSLTDTVS